MKAHLYMSSTNGKVVFCQHCGRVAFDLDVGWYERVDRMQDEAAKPCPLAPDQPSGDKGE
jgi:hypothetical protein